MKKFQVAYIPIGVGTFHLESAQKAFDASLSLLREINADTVAPKEMLLTLDLLKEYLDSIEPDLIVLQNVTFANAAYASEVVKRFNAPILLWTLREPVIDGTRLRLNSLTGAFSAANTIKAFREEPFEYIFGAPEEKEVREKIAATVAAAKLKFDLRSLKLAAIGHTPQGFGFGRASDSEMLKAFGVTLESIEARELIDKAKNYTDEELDVYLQDASKRISHLETTPENNRRDFARLYKAYDEYTKNAGIGALASRCWPDFFTAFGTPVCAVLSILNDLNIPSACEADTYGALSMYMCYKLTGSPAFFGDPVSMDEKESTITFWHCGMAACSLARQPEGACVGVHCNRKIGPTLDFGCKPCNNVTIFRVGKDSKGNFRFFIEKGKALDMPKQFNGTSVVIKTDRPSKDIIYDAVCDGFEPHFAVAYGDIEKELTILAHMLNIPVVG